MGGERKKKIRWLLLSISMIAAASILMGVLFVQNHLGGVEHYEERIKAAATDHAQRIGNELSMFGTVGMTVSSILGTEDLGEDEFIKVASSILENTDAGQVMYYNGSGIGYLWDGSNLETKDVAEDASFQELLSASDVTYAFAENGGNGHDAAVLAAAPVEGGDKKDLILFYSAVQLCDMLKIEVEFEANAVAALTDANGNLLYHDSDESRYLAGANLWDYLEENGETDTLKQSFMSQMTGSFHAVSKDKSEARTFAYAPIGINGWMYVLGVDQAYLDDWEFDSWKQSRIALYLLIAVILFFLSAFFLFLMLDNKKSEEKDRMLVQKAETDLLTGLTNKLSTEYKITEYIESHPGELGMLFVFDIDDFKKINDSRGHAFGDKVLSTIGKRLSATFRVTDVVGRIGGDEFAVFLKHLKNHENVKKEARKLENFFKDFTVDDYKITASIGAVVYPDHGKDFVALYHAADKALYMAKRRGKHQLAFYEDKFENPAP